MPWANDFAVTVLASLLLRPQAVITDAPQEFQGWQLAFIRVRSFRWSCILMFWLLHHGFLTIPQFHKHLIWKCKC